MASPARSQHGHSGSASPGKDGGTLSLRTGSPSKYVTRLGVATPKSPMFGLEERFAWQKGGGASDVMYEMPSMNSGMGARFGTETRKGMDDVNPDAKKRSTGPGSYQVEACYDSNSDYPTRLSYKFGCAPRQSMAMKTPSPGAIYNTDGLYACGSDKTIPISFNKDTRQAPGNVCASANADMLWPKLPSGPAITIAGKLNKKSHFGGGGTPGAIYDVHKKVDFRTGPSFSFGRSRAPRFDSDRASALSLDNIADVK